MENSVVHLVKVFLLGKNSYDEQKRRCRYFAQNQFFMNSVLSVEVLKLAITTINCEEFLHQAKGKTNICIG